MLFVSAGACKNVGKIIIQHEIRFCREQFQRVSSYYCRQVGLCFVNIIFFESIL